MNYQIFRCINCNKLNLSKSGGKSKICAFCGKKNDLGKVHFIVKASTPKEARMIISKLKAECNF